MLLARVAIYRRVGDFRGADQRPTALGRGVFEIFRLGRAQQVEAQIEIHRAGEEAIDHRLRGRTDEDRRLDRSTFLRQPGIVGEIDIFALHHRGIGQQVRYGHHTRAAPAHSEDGIGPIEIALGRIGQGVQRLGLPAFQASTCRGFDYRKRRAFAVYAQAVLRAIGLAHLGLFAEFGIDAIERSATLGLGIAIAAAFADALVDQHVLLRTQPLTPPLSALLSRALLVENQYRRAGDFFETRKRLTVPLQPENLDALRIETAVALGGFADNAHPHYPEPQQFLHHVGNRSLTAGCLAAGQRHRPVEQQ